AVKCRPLIRQRMGGDRLATQAVQVADRQLRHQARLLEDLLDTSRVVLGKIVLHHADVDRGALVGQAVEASQLLFEKRAQQVTVSKPDNAITVRADPDRLEQILKNLLSNAAKYTPPGESIAVTVGVGEGMGTVRIRDRGIGIEPHILPRIFDLFFQADASLARSEGGLGVGLTLARHLVEMQDGALVARSEGRGRGGELEVRLPLAGGAEAAGEAAAPAVESPAGSRRILMVEDNRDAREMLRVLLELHGHHVDEARDGRTAIRMAAASAPEVVLIDLGLPDLD